MPARVSPVDASTHAHGPRSRHGRTRPTSCNLCTKVESLPSRLARCVHQVRPRQWQLGRLPLDDCGFCEGKPDRTRGDRAAWWERWGCEKGASLRRGSRLCVRACPTDRYRHRYRSMRGRQACASVRRCRDGHGTLSRFTQQCRDRPRLPQHQK